MLSLRRGRATAVALTLALAGGCSRAGSAPSGAAVAVRLSNFAIDLPAVVRPGKTTFVIDGRGPTMHEFNVVRTGRDPKQLPVDAAGLVDDQTPHADFTHLAEAEGIDIGDHKTLTVNLTPGTYAVYCNMDGHYQAGMANRIVVRPA